MSWVCVYLTHTHTHTRKGHRENIEQVSVYVNSESLLHIVLTSTQWYMERQQEFGLVPDSNVNTTTLKRQSGSLRLIHHPSLKKTYQSWSSLPLGDESMKASKWDIIFTWQLIMLYRHIRGRLNGITLSPSSNIRASGMKLCVFPQKTPPTHPPSTLTHTHTL